MRQKLIEDNLHVGFEVFSNFSGIAQWGDVFECETKGFTFKNIPKITNANFSTRLIGFVENRLTYGFCSKDLKRLLSQKDLETGIKNGRIDPIRDQHMAHEKNRNGKYYCDRLGAACDFRIVGLASDRLVEWILEQQLPFDSLYYYGGDRPIHISYAPQQKQNIWTFTDGTIVGHPQTGRTQSRSHSTRIDRID